VSTITKTCTDCLQTKPADQFYARGSSKCRYCKQEYCRKWYLENKEHKNESSREWASANAERVNELARERYLADPDYFKARARAQYRANPEYYKARQRERYWRLKAEASKIA
jgi:hypothetical protein